MGIIKRLSGVFRMQQNRHVRRIFLTLTVIGSLVTGREVEASAWSHLSQSTAAFLRSGVQTFATYRPAIVEYIKLATIFTGVTIANENIRAFGPYITKKANPLFVGGFKHFKTDIAKLIPQSTPDPFDAPWIGTLPVDLQRTADALKNPGVRRLAGCDTACPENVLLYGEPGNGKTSWVKYLAKVTGRKVVSFNAAKAIGKYVSEGTTNIDDAFNEAEQNPEETILFIDEVDSIAIDRNRNTGESTGDREYLNMANMFLQRIENTTKKGLLVVAATNAKEKLDGAIIRDGRFSKHVKLENPGQEQIQGILAHYLTKDLHQTYTNAKKIFSRRSKELEALNPENEFNQQKIQWLAQNTAPLLANRNLSCVNIKQVVINAAELKSETLLHAEDSLSENARPLTRAMSRADTYRGKSFITSNWIPNIFALKIGCATALSGFASLADYGGILEKASTSILFGAVTAATSYYALRGFLKITDSLLKKTNRPDFPYNESKANELLKIKKNTLETAAIGMIQTKAEAANVSPHPRRLSPIREEEEAVPVVPATSAASSIQATQPSLVQQLVEQNRVTLQAGQELFKQNQETLQLLRESMRKQKQPKITSRRPSLVRHHASAPRAAAVQPKAAAQSAPSRIVVPSEPAFVQAPAFNPAHSRGHRAFEAGLATLQNMPRRGERLRAFSV